MSVALRCTAAAILLLFSHILTAADAYTYAQLNYTTSPSQAFVGSFYGPIYSPGVAEPSCSVLISPGLGTTTFLVVPNVTYTDPSCTNLAAIPFAYYTFLGVTQVKCIGPGEGYQLNYPANVVWSTPNSRWSVLLHQVQDVQQRDRDDLHQWRQRRHPVS